MKVVFIYYCVWADTMASVWKETNYTFFLLPLFTASVKTETAETNMPRFNDSGNDSDEAYEQMKWK